METQVSEFLITQGVLGVAVLILLVVCGFLYRQLMAAQRRERKLLLSVAKIKIDAENSAEYESLIDATETTPVRPETLAQALKEVAAEQD